VLKNREERSIEIAEEMKKSVQMNDDLRQLSTSFESSSPQHLSPQIISLRSDLTEDDRISRFQSFDAEDAAESSNVIVRRKDKGKKFDQLSAIDQTSLDVTEIQIDLKEFQSSSRDIVKDKMSETLMNLVWNRISRDVKMLIISDVCDLRSVSNNPR
jgi:hypothetical protein